MKVFNGGGGAWYDTAKVCFTTEGDNRVWTYDPVADAVAIIYDDSTSNLPVPGLASRRHARLERGHRHRLSGAAPSRPAGGGVQRAGGAVEGGMERAQTRYAGLAAVAVLWTTLGLAALRAGFPLAGERPLSWLAADPASSALYSTGLAVGALLLAVFHGHVRARYRVSRGFSVAMLAGLAGQAVAAFVPISGGPLAHRVHTVAALTLGASLPVLMWRFALTQQRGPWRRLVKRLALAEGAACAVGVALSRLSVAPLAEILPAACFHVWIAVLTFGPAGTWHAGQESPARLGC